MQIQCQMFGVRWKCRLSMWMAGSYQSTALHVRVTDSSDDRNQRISHVRRYSGHLEQSSSGTAASQTAAWPVQSHANKLTELLIQSSYYDTWYKIDVFIVSSSFVPWHRSGFRSDSHQFCSRLRDSSTHHHHHSSLLWIVKTQLNNKR